MPSIALRRAPVHAALVVLAALTGACPTVDVGEDPVTPPDCSPDMARFMEPGGIWDVAIAPADTTKSCIVATGCHSQANGRSAFRVINKPRATFTPDEWQQNYEAVSRFLNCTAPEASTLITKPTVGRDSHVGGDLWSCTGTCEPQRTIEQWIQGL